MKRFLPHNQRVAAFFGAALAFGVGPLSAQSDPVAYWSFDTDFSATVGGPTFNGVAVNGTTISATQARFGGGSAQFDRTLQQYISIQASPFTQGSYTYAGWYYLDLADIAGSARYSVVEASNAGNSTWPASFGLRELSTVDSGQVFTHDNITNSTAAHSRSFDAGSHQEWRHIAVTYDADTKSFGIFLDGVDLEIGFTLPEGSTGISESTHMIIGGHRAGTGRNWNGFIDDFAVWDRVLSQGEISTLQTTAVPEPATVALLFGIGATGLALWHRRKKVCVG